MSTYFASNTHSAVIDRATALVFSPLSELYGRRIIYVTTFGVAVIFVIPSAVSKNVETLLVCRAIGGIAISVPVANVGVPSVPLPFWDPSRVCSAATSCYKQHWELRTDVA